MEIRYAIDPSLHTFVGVCREPGCCYRALTTSRPAALRARHEHAETHRVRHPRLSTRPAKRRCEDRRDSPDD